MHGMRLLNTRLNAPHLRKVDRMIGKVKIVHAGGYDPKKVPELLDKVTDVVLAYRPTPKSKGAKKRVRKAKKAKADAQER